MNLEGPDSDPGAWETPPGAGDPSPRLEAALHYAAAGLPVVASHFPVPLRTSRTPGRPALGCSCGEATCATPARHPVWSLTERDATTATVDLVRWWIGIPDANLATPTAPDLGLVELCHRAPPHLVVGWLAMHGIAAGPLIAAGPGCLQFLVIPGSGGWSFRMVEHGSVLRLGPGGGLVLLPPSRLISGAWTRWLQPPEQAGPPPDGDRLFEALLHIPGAVELVGSMPREAAKPLGSGGDAPD
ncbi:MAG TPA: bifunctional DNA primase/polymerase [Actinomycetota bacterium]